MAPLGVLTRGLCLASHSSASYTARLYLSAVDGVQTLESPTSAVAFRLPLRPAAGAPRRPAACRSLDGPARLQHRRTPDRRGKRPDPLVLPDRARRALLRPGLGSLPAAVRVPEGLIDKPPTFPEPRGETLRLARKAGSGLRSYRASNQATERRLRAVWWLPSVRVETCVVDLLARHAHRGGLVHLGEHLSGRKVDRLAAATVEALAVLRPPGARRLRGGFEGLPSSRRHIGVVSASYWSDEREGFLVLRRGVRRSPRMRSTGGMGRKG